jgi:hypothetical protein
MSISALIDGEVTRLSGPELPAKHVLNWLVDDSQAFSQCRHGPGIMFSVCPVHSEPEECDCCIGLTHMLVLTAAGPGWG